MPTNDSTAIRHFVLRVNNVKEDSHTFPRTVARPPFSTHFIMPRQLRHRLCSARVMVHAACIGRRTQPILSRLMKRYSVQKSFRFANIVGWMISLSVFSRVPVPNYRIIRWSGFKAQESVQRLKIWHKQQVRPVTERADMCSCLIC